MSEDKDEKEQFPIPKYKRKLTTECERCNFTINKGVRMCPNCRQVICPTCRD